MSIFNIGSSNEEEKSKKQVYWIPKRENDVADTCMQEPMKQTSLNAVYPCPHCQVTMVLLLPETIRIQQTQGSYV